MTRENQKGNELCQLFQNFAALRSVTRNSPSSGPPLGDRHSVAPRNVWTPTSKASDSVKPHPTRQSSENELQRVFNVSSACQATHMINVHCTMYCRVYCRDCMWRQWETSSCICSMVKSWYMWYGHPLRTGILVMGIQIPINGLMTIHQHGQFTQVSTMANMHMWHNM